MISKLTLATALILGGGAGASALALQGPGDTQQKPQGGVTDVVDLPLKLDANTSYRYEVVVSGADTGMQSGGATKPGDSSNPRQGDRQEDSNQPRGSTFGSPDQNASTDRKETLEISVRQAQEGRGATLVVKRSPSATPGSTGQPQAGSTGKQMAHTYIAEVAANGQVRSIRAEHAGTSGGKTAKAPGGSTGDSQDDQDRRDQSGQSQGTDQTGSAHQSASEDEEIEVVRAGLNLILGSGLHDGEIRKGEKITIGSAKRATGRPVEAGARTGQSEPGKSSRQEAGGSHALEECIDLSELEVELRSVEMRGQERVAVFSILGKDAKSHSGSTGGFGRADDDKEDAESGQDTRDELERSARKAQQEMKGKGDSHVSYSVQDGWLLSMVHTVQPEGAQPFGKVDRKDDRQDDRQGDSQDDRTDRGSTQQGLSSEHAKARTIKIRRL